MLLDRRAVEGFSARLILEDRFECREKCFKRFKEPGVRAFALENSRGLGPVFGRGPIAKIHAFARAASTAGAFGTGLSPGRYFGGSMRIIYVEDLAFGSVVEGVTALSDIDVLVACSLDEGLGG